MALPQSHSVEPVCAGCRRIKRNFQIFALASQGKKLLRPSPGKGPFDHYIPCFYMAASAAAFTGFSLAGM